jgi:hypothetical protein
MAEESAESEHRVLASVAVADGYRMECLCGWVVVVSAPLDLFDAWADHCVNGGSASRKTPGGESPSPP